MNFNSSSSSKSSTPKSTSNAFNKEERKSHSDFKKVNGPKKNTHKK
ncbi:hypothetical protein M918_08655 [Clostridium sp. BL8]|nr:hypothetical protein M918_08655 [Clostridium sp. BL8]